MTTILKRPVAFEVTEAELLAQLPAIARALPPVAGSWLSASEVYDQLPALAGFGDGDR